MKVMAFDIAGRTGVAYGPAGGTPLATSVDLGKGRSEVARFSRMLDATDHFLNHYKPDLVVFEAPIGGPKTSHFLVGIAACFQAQAKRLGYDPVAVSLASVRKHFLGKHLTTKHYPGLNYAAAKRAIKLAVVDRCHLLGWDVEGDDEADACAIWDYACATKAGVQAAPVGGLFRVTA